MILLVFRNLESTHCLTRSLGCEPVFSTHARVSTETGSLQKSTGRHRLPRRRCNLFVNRLAFADKLELPSSYLGGPAGSQAAGADCGCSTNLWPPVSRAQPIRAGRPLP